MAHIYMTSMIGVEDPLDFTPRPDYPNGDVTINEKDGSPVHLVYWTFPTRVIGRMDFRTESEYRNGLPTPGALTVPKIMMALKEKDDNLDGYIGEVVDYQNDVIARPSINALEQRLEIPRGTIASSKFGDIYSELRLEHCDPTHVNRWAPQRGSFRRGSKIKFAGQLIRTEQLTPGSSILNNTIESLKKQYSIFRAYAEIGKDEDEINLRLWMLKRILGGSRLRTGLFDGEDYKLLLPDANKGDVWLAPGTTYGPDTFTVGANIALGVYTGAPWTGDWSEDFHTAGAFTVRSATNDARPGTGGGGDTSGRADHVAHTGDEHHAEANINAFETGSATSFAHLWARMNSGTPTQAVLVRQRGSSFSTDAIFEWTDGGGLAELGTATDGDQQSSGELFEIDVDAADEITMTVDSVVERQETTSNIFGGTQTGMGGAKRPLWDNFLSSETAAALDDQEWAAANGYVSPVMHQPHPAMLGS